MPDEKCDHYRVEIALPYTASRHELGGDDGKRDSRERERSIGAKL